MSGTKNHSGKYPKGWSDWDIDKLVNHSVRLVAKLLDDPDIDKAKKLEVAASFARKIIPETTFVEHSHSISHEDRLLLRDRLRKATQQRLQYDEVLEVTDTKIDEESSDGPERVGQDE